MRMTIAIDDRLFEEAKKLTDVKTKKELINLSLRELIRRKRQQHLAGLYGCGLVDLTVEDVEELRRDEV
jgi:Arc/MetJ family transcription regulator